MIKLTMEEKQRYAEILRKPGSLAFDPPVGYLDCLKKVIKKEVKITGREGNEITVWITVPGDPRENDMCYLNIHGGGFVQPHHVWDEALCAVMSLEFGCMVVDVDYRLAPDAPYPAALNDCCDVYLWMLAHSQELEIDQDKIVIGGNSAGGSLSAGVCLKAAQEGFRVPALVVMLYPACSLNEVPEALDEGMDLTDLKTRGILFTLLYLETSEQYKEPYANLIKADTSLLEGFPDTIMVTGGQDPLRFDGEEFAKRLAVSGSTVVIKRFVNSKHGFYTRMSDQWQEARRFVFDQIRQFMCGK